MDKKYKKKTKYGSVQPNQIPKAMLIEDPRSFNAILKTETSNRWSEKELVPIDTISLSNSDILELNSKAIKFLSTGNFKFTIEAKIETTEETVITYVGSACSNKDYQESFLTKRLEPGINMVSWTTIIEAVRGQETALICDHLCSFNGQIVIIKI